MNGSGWSPETGDTIFIHGVRALGTHGVLASEHAVPQPFEVDLELLVDLTAAAASDDLGATADYAQAAATAVAVIEGEHADLIEVLAARIADAVLAGELVEQVRVRVRKPQAPVGVPFTDVGVTLTRRDVRTAVVALGANEGDAAVTLARAAGGLRVLPRTRVRALSPLFLTDPVGGPQQPPYLNAVAVLDTTLRPAGLMRLLHEIEDRAGRVRTVRWGPRTLDLDLVQYGDPLAGTDVVTGAGQDTGDALVLPHPRAAGRAFVLAPWLAADPGAHLRAAGQVSPVAQLLAGLPGPVRDGVRGGPSWPVMTC